MAEKVSISLPDVDLSLAEREKHQRILRGLEIRALRIGEYYTTAQKIALEQHYMILGQDYGDPVLKPT